MIEQIIIIGGGSSIKDLIKFDLWKELKNTCTIGVNFSFRDYCSTFLCCADFKFYTGCVKCVWMKNSKGVDYLNTKVYDRHFRQELKNLPLIVAPKRKDISSNNTPTGEKALMKNTILLPYTTAHQYYGKDSKPEEIYHIIDQSGMWALGVACEIPTVKEIYLLGFDFGLENGESHYYNHTKHRGQLPQVNSWYKRNEKDNGADYFYKPFIERYPNVKIYNVNVNSKINCFHKISDYEFFSKIKGLPESQETLRKSIRKSLS